MKAYEVMKKPVIKVFSNESVRTVVERFIKHGISGMPVVNEEKEVVAYISDGDIMRYIGKHKDYVYDTFFFIGFRKGDQENFEERAKQILDLNVMEIARHSVIKTTWNTEVEDIAAILGKKKIKKLPVEQDGKIIGVISRGDVIRNSFKQLL